MPKPENRSGAVEGELISELTDQEIRIAKNATVDLGSGYPYLRLPAWMRDPLVTTPNPDLVYGFPPYTSSEAVSTLNRDLLTAACDLLRIDTTHVANGFVTFSGSVALNRAIESQLGRGRTIISTSPSIDIIPGMISERPDANAVYVPCLPNFDLDINAILEALDDSTDCMIFTSPENPTGNVISADNLRTLCEAAIDHDVTLILDQCFALIDPYNVGIPILPNIAPPGLKWIFLWDTGKTFGLNEDKLGFLFCSDDLREHLSERLNILQFDVSRRLKVVFTALLRAAKTNGYSSTLSDLVRTNLETSIEACASAGLTSIAPDAGSFLLIDTAGTEHTAASLADVLLDDYGLGTIRTSSFFQHGHTTERDRYLRLAMARNTDVIDDALARLSTMARTT